MLKFWIWVSLQLMLSDLSPQFQVPNADLLKCNGLCSSKCFIAFKGFPSKNHSFSQEKKQPYQVLVLKYAVKYIRLWKAASKKLFWREITLVIYSLFPLLIESRCNQLQSNTFWGATISPKIPKFLGMSQSDLHYFSLIDTDWGPSVLWVAEGWPAPIKR